MKWTNKGKEYEVVANTILESDVDYYVWGAGTFGISFAEMISKYVNIIGFIDIKKELIGKQILGLDVFTPDSLKKKGKKTRVLIANGWLKQCKSYLIELGLEEYKDFFVAADFISIFFWYAYKKNVCLSINYEISTFCTLKCKNCMAFIPYTRKPRNLEVQQVEKELDCLFSWVDYLLVLGLGGGDAFVNPHLCEIIELIFEKYNDKVKDLEIYTNAIIMPSKRLIDVLSKYNVIVRFTDYSGILDKQRIDEFEKICVTNNIRYDKARWENWYDTRRQNAICDDSFLRGQYKDCLTKLCTVIQDYKLFFCSLHSCAIRAEKCDLLESDFFDLRRPIGINEKLEFMEFNTGKCDRGYVEYCKLCNGYQNSGAIEIPVAEQIGGNL